jgi:hypothetical protein
VSHAPKHSNLSPANKEYDRIKHATEILRSVCHSIVAIVQNACNRQIITLSKIKLADSLWRPIKRFLEN